MFLAKITCIFCIILFITQCQSDCVTPANSLKNILVLDNNNNVEYSDDQGNIVKKDGEYITLACPGSNLNINSKMNKVSLTCSNNAYPKHKIPDITCVKPLISRERRLGNCNGGYYHMQIGYQFTGVRGDFIPHIDFCWDDVKKRALWSHSHGKLQKHTGECHVESNRPSFRSGNYFPSSLSKYYTEAQQLNTLRAIHKRTPPQVNTNNLLEPGHLVAKCDLVYDAQQRLTFHYTNAAPKWKSLENWRDLESQIQKLIQDEDGDFEVYTGTFGTLQIEGKDYYLNSQSSQIPVPKYFWKVVIKKELFQTLGVAIVVSNDIFNSSDDICRDIMGSINWLYINKAKDRLSGNMIACDVSDFVNIKGLKDELPPSFASVNGVLSGDSAVPIAANFDFE